MQVKLCLTGEFVVNGGDGSWADGFEAEVFHEGPGFFGGIGLGDSGVDVCLNMFDEVVEVVELGLDGLFVADGAVAGDDCCLVVAELEDASE